MADKFYDGMPNVNEELNKLNTAFEKGPYNALPLTGGALAGPVTSSSSISVVGLTVTATPDPIRKTSLSPPLAGVQNSGVYEVARLGVSQSATGFGGAFLLSTTTGQGGDFTLKGHVLSISNIDTQTASESAPLFKFTGFGGFSAGSVTPMVDNRSTVGNASAAYATLYARTGTINTSDARLKCDLRYLTSAEIAAARDIARAIGVYRWRDAVECKGEGAREHIGPTVQRAIEIMQAHGLDPFNYGFICHDTWEQQTVEHPAVEARPAIPATDAAPEVLDTFGDVITPAVLASEGFPAVEARAAYTEVVLEAGDRYAFRYDELAMFIAAGQEARLAALEAA